MIEFKAKIVDISTSLLSDKIRLTIEYDGNPADVQALQNDDVRVSIQKWRDKRSLDANAYCWKLCTEIANVLTLGGAVTTKDDVYIQMLKAYGQSDIITIRSDVPPERFFDYFDEVGKGMLKGKEYTSYRVTIGSSKYDTREMSILLDGIIHEAKQLGISTMTPKEIEQLKQRWSDIE